MRKIILDQIPLERLFLIHPLNRKYLEGKTPRTFFETDRLKMTGAFWVLNIILVVMSIYILIFHFETVRAELRNFWFLLIVPLITVTLAATSFFEYDRERRLRKYGKFLLGQIQEYKILGDRHSDTPTIVITYSFTTSDGEKVNTVTPEENWLNNSHFYIPKKIKRFAFWGETIKPNIGDLVIVQFLDKKISGLNVDDFNIL
jgi:hypothetical protein